MMRLKRQTLDAIVEGAAMGSSATTVTALVAATVALLYGDLFTAGLCLAAALVSLGLLTNAVFIGVRRANERQLKERWPLGRDRRGSTCQK